MTSKWHASKKLLLSLKDRKNRQNRDKILPGWPIHGHTYYVITVQKKISSFDKKFISIHLLTSTVFWYYNLKVVFFFLTNQCSALRLDKLFRAYVQDHNDFLNFISPKIREILFQHYTSLSGKVPLINSLPHGKSTEEN